MFVALLIFAADIEALKPNEHIVSVQEVLPGKRRIVHIKDWHLVAKQSFAIDTGLEGSELDEAYAEHLLTVARVQDAQRGILRAGIREVHLEGLTDANYPIFLAEIRVLKRHRREIEELSPEDGQAAKELLDRHALTMLRIGAAGKLMLDDALTVLPCEGPEYEQKPIRNGQIVLDQKEIEAREDAIVRTLLMRKGNLVLVLGGGHDLSDNIQRQSKHVGYTIVTPKGCPN